MGENIYENVMDTMELREKVDAAVEEKRQQLAEQRQLLAETKEQAAELRRKYKELAERSLRTGRHMLRAFPKLQPDVTRKFWNRSGKGSEQRAGIRACAGDKWISVLTEYRNHL